MFGTRKKMAEALCLRLNSIYYKSININLKTKKRYEQ